MKLLRFVEVGLFCCFCALRATTQSQQLTSPSGLPEVMVLVHQEFQFGNISLLHGIGR